MHIAAKSQQFMDAGDPVISVDTKKKELIGNYKNGGREYAPQGEAQQVNTHDVGDRDAQKRVKRSIPYGVYDQGQNTGGVSVGVDHDTAEFAVATIRQWWKQMGEQTYPNTRKVLKC